MGFCDTCLHNIYIGGGDFWCEEIDAIVAEDFSITDYYMSCDNKCADEDE